MHLHIDSLFRKRQTPSTVHAVTSENPQPDDPPAPTWAGMGVAYDEKRLPPTFWMIIAALTLGLIVSVAFQSAESGTFLLLMVLALPAGLAARSLGQPADKKWLPNLLMAGWAAKMFASGGRYWALQVLYNGVGDATGYHGRGVQYSPIWRSLQLPPLGTGTDFIDAAAGFLYIPYIPTKLGGFFIFATLAFVGQILYYTAFRRSVKTVGLKWYALLVFFFPNIIYWPSSIGKESLITLFIGLSAYGAVRLFADYRPKWVAVLAIGLTGAGLIRSHIALLLILSVAGAMFLGRRPTLEAARLRRLISLVGIAVVLVAAVSYAIQDFGVDLSAGVSASLVEDELDPIFSGVEDQTDKGGSAVEGTAIRSPLDVPEAVLRVVFRPLPTDAHNIQALVSSIVEGSFLLALFIWRTPAIVKNFRARWREPYVMFALIYTAGFIFGHSPVLNLGIMARQRSQLIPFVLVLLVALGAGKTSEPKPTVPEQGSVPAGNQF